MWYPLNLLPFGNLEPGTSLATSKQYDGKLAALLSAYGQFPELFFDPNIKLSTLCHQAKLVVERFSYTNWVPVSPLKAGNQGLDFFRG